MELQFKSNWNIFVVHFWFRFYFMNCIANVEEVRQNALKTFQSSNFEKILHWKQRTIKWMRNLFAQVEFGRYYANVFICVPPPPEPITNDLIIFDILKLDWKKYVQWDVFFFCRFNPCHRHNFSAEHLHLGWLLFISLFNKIRQG